MNITIPDSLSEFVVRQADAGHYANADAFVADLIRAEAEIFRRTGQGAPFPIDEHFERRLEMLLDEAGADYVAARPEDFDAMEREALDLLGKSKSS